MHGRRAGITHRAHARRKKRVGTAAAAASAIGWAAPRPSRFLIKIKERPSLPLAAVTGSKATLLDQAAGSIRYFPGTLGKN